MVLLVLLCRLHRQTPPEVALRKESVDRNTKIFSTSSLALIVALRKESVDRNEPEHADAEEDVAGRSPQGERG